MLNAYLACALWTSVDTDGTPLEKNYNIYDFSPEALVQAHQACDQFVALYASHPECEEINATWSPEHLGYNLWLTRNRHGAGFWDSSRPYGEYLTKLAHSMGESDLYVGDDGLMYFT